MTDKEIEWHKTYMKFANEYARKSKDPKFKVGCVIVTEEGILYPGYNGDEIGGTNKRDSMGTGGSGFIHAEINCLIKYNPTIHRNSKLYVTYNPCIVCARSIVNAITINGVYYDKEYSADMRGVELLNSRGILCEQLKGEWNE